MIAQRTIQMDSNQIYIYFPREIVEALGWEKGGKVMVVLAQDRIEIHPSEEYQPSSLDQSLSKERIIQDDGQCYIYLPREFVEALALTKGEKVMLLTEETFNRRLAIYAEKTFVVKIGMGGINDGLQPSPVQ
jgi:antitoxin component of MazEF toxin-antitoxin module